MKLLHILPAILFSLSVLSCSGNDNNAAGGGDDKSSSGEAKPVHLTKETFKKKVMDYENNKEWNYLGERPAVIDFYADWCAPCKKVAPIMEDLAKDYEGEVDIYKIDTEDQKELAAIFGIKSIPSVLFIPMEGKPQMTRGALPKDNFVSIVEEFLLNNPNENKE
jgi:thioredoxin